MTGHFSEPRVGALHNMSTPPRTRISVRPLRLSGVDTPMMGDLVEAAGIGTGLALVATVFVSRMLQRYFPDYQDVSPIDKNPGWRDQRRLKGLAARRDNLRLRCMVVLSRLAVGELQQPNRGAIFRLADVPVEVLEAIWLDNVRCLKPEDHSLPSFGLVRPVPLKALNADCLEASPARALAIISRCGGNVYSADREPGLPDYTRQIQPVQLYGFSSGGGAHE